jgi:hypothetical protein
MLTLLILLVIVYLFVGVCELCGICECLMFEPHERMPNVWESVLIVVGWGVYEYRTWRRKQNG